MTCQGQPQLLHLSSPGCLPELWPWIWPVESVALPLSSGRHTPATAPAHPVARAQPCVDCAAPLGELSALFPSHLRQEPRLLLVRGGLLARGPNFLTPFCSRNAASSAPSIEWEGDRVQAEHNARPPLPCPRLSCTASLCSTGRGIPTALGALFNTLFSRTVSELPRVLLPTPSSRPSCAGTLPTRTRKGDRVALERLRALLRACS